jgi:type IV secretion system protein VirB6
MAFFQTYLGGLSDTCATYMNGTVSNLAAAFAPTAVILVTIYVMFWGWAMIRGMVEEPILDGFTRILRLITIVTIATVGAHFNTYLSSWLWDTPDRLGAVIAGGPPRSTLMWLDTSWDRIFIIGNSYVLEAKRLSILGIPDLQLLGCGLFIWAAGVIVLAYAGFLVALSKIALALVIAVGPIAVLLLIFEATKGFFNSWLGQAANYIMLSALTAGAISLMLKIMDDFTLAILPLAATSVFPGLVAATNAFPLIIICLLIFLVLMQAPSIASALGGGVAVGTLGAAAAVYGRLMGAAAGAKNIISGKALADMRQARQHKMRMARFANSNPGGGIRERAMSGAGTVTGTLAAGAKNLHQAGGYVAGRAAGAVYKRITQSRTNRVSSG